MILNVYKPKNWTSYDVVAKLKGVLREKQAQKFISMPNAGLAVLPSNTSAPRAPITKKKLKPPKIGHAGTLDPLAEGVLMILTGDDTKKQDFIMKQPKEYIAEIAFGAQSPTYDMEMVPEFKGNIEEFSDLKAFEEAVIKEMPQFVGHITQTVPNYSAKKIGGVAMYKAAREGADAVAELTAVGGAPTKEVDVFAFDVISAYTQDVETSAGIKALPVLKCRIRCSSGTYVRSIAHEMGEKLGTGAVLISLIRSRVGDFLVEESKSLDVLEVELAK